MILVEPLIETTLRTAVRASLTTFGATTPALVDAKIICSWLGSEDGGDAEDADDLCVFIGTHTGTVEGWIAASGPMPFRDIIIDVGCVSQPDSDRDRAICRALYEAVRTAFESPASYAFPTGVTFGGIESISGVAPSIEDQGMMKAFTVKIKASV